MRIARIGMENPRQVEAAGQRKGLRINLRAADDEDLLFGREQRHRLFERMGHPASRNLHLLPRDDHIGPVGQRPSERLVGLAPHDDGMARRNGLEVFQVFGNMPQQGVLIADHTVFGDGYDDAYHIYLLMRSAAAVRLRRPAALQR